MKKIMNTKTTLNLLGLILVSSGTGIQSASAIPALAQFEMEATVKLVDTTPLPNAKI